MARIPIDPTIAKVARHFGIDVYLLAAIEKAEGGPERLVRAVQCSFPNVTTREEALEITARSIAHRLSDFVVALQLERSFVVYMGAKWAPLGAENDPKHLNENWVPNVTKLWLGPPASRMDTGPDIPGGGAA